MDCPITMEKMKMPKVLPCGHTFDGRSLKRLTRCPLCRRGFECRPEDLPINWILVDMDPESWHRMIRSVTEDEHSRLMMINMEEITWKLLCTADKGRSSIRLSRSNIIGCPRSIRAKILGMVVDRLRGMGFSVAESHTSCWSSSVPTFIISWSFSD